MTPLTAAVVLLSLALVTAAVLLLRVLLRRYLAQAVNPPYVAHTDLPHLDMPVGQRWPSTPELGDSSELNR